MEAYDTGISNFEDETPRVRDRLMTIGNKTTTTGVLLIKAERKATNTNKTNVNLTYPYLQNFPSASVTCSMRWHRFRDALIINIAAIVRGASFEKTEKTSLVLGQLSLRLKPEMTKIRPINESAVTSTLTFSIKNEVNAAQSKPRASIDSQSIFSIDYFMARHTAEL
jgi:hypothetical protein